MISLLFFVGLGKKVVDELHETREWYWDKIPQRLRLYLFNSFFYVFY